MSTSSHRSLYNFSKLAKCSTSKLLQMIDWSGLFRSRQVLRRLLGYAEDAKAAESGSVEPPKTTRSTSVMPPVPVPSLPSVPSVPRTEVSSMSRSQPAEAQHSTCTMCSLCDAFFIQFTDGCRMGGNMKPFQLWCIQALAAAAEAAQVCGLMLQQAVEMHGNAKQSSWPKMRVGVFI